MYFNFGSGHPFSSIYPTLAALIRYLQIDFYYSSRFCSSLALATASQALGIGEVEVAN